MEAEDPKVVPAVPEVPTEEPSATPTIEPTEKTAGDPSTEQPVVDATASSPDKAVAQKRRKSKAAEGEQPPKRVLERRGGKKAEEAPKNVASSPAGKRKKKAEDDVDSPDSLKQAAKGRKVEKEFDGKMYSGVVERYWVKQNYYSVLYEDGDKEDYFWKELKPLLCPVEPEQAEPKEADVATKPEADVATESKADVATDPEPTPYPVVEAEGGVAEQTKEAVETVIPSATPDPVEEPKEPVAENHVAEGAVAEGKLEENQGAEKTSQWRKVDGDSTQPVAKRGRPRGRGGRGGGKGRGGRKSSGGSKEEAAEEPAERLPSKEPAEKLPLKEPAEKKARCSEGSQKSSPASLRVQAPRSTKRQPQVGQEAVGRKVKKMFDGQYYEGHVAKYFKGDMLYRVVYEDDDYEDLTMDELMDVIQDEKLAEIPPMPEGAKDKEEEPEEGKVEEGTAEATDKEAGAGAGAEAGAEAEVASGITPEEVAPATPETAAAAS